MYCGCENPSKGDIHDPETGETRVPFWTSQRWILVYIGFLATVVIFSFRVNMSVAIVCMVRQDGEDNQTLANMSMPEDRSRTQEFQETSVTARSSSAEFTWSRIDQSKLLSYYYFGYIAVQVVGGSLARAVGGKPVVTVSLLASSLLTLLTPVLTRASFEVSLVLRVLLGVFGGITFPSMYALVGRWSPPQERSRMLSVFYIGTFYILTSNGVLPQGLNLSVVVAYAPSGFLCKYGFDNGWPSIFYLQGISGVVVLLLWHFLTASSPDEHPRISKEEKRFLDQTVPPVSKDKPNVPWRELLTSVPLWGLVLSHMLVAWVYYVILICLPLFLKEVHKFDIQRNGLMSSLPFISGTLGLLGAGQCADFLISKKWLTILSTRRLFQTTCYMGLIIFLLPIGFIACSQRWLVVLFFSLCMFFLSLGDAAGYACSLVEIAPQYASITFAISNTMATIPANVAPPVVAVLTGNRTSEEWRLIFYISAGCALMAAVVYWFSVSAEIQPWARANRETDTMAGNRELEIPEKETFLKVTLNSDIKINQDTSGIDTDKIHCQIEVK